MFSFQQAQPDYFSFVCFLPSMNLMCSHAWSQSLNDIFSFLMRSECGVCPPTVQWNMRDFGRFILRYGRKVVDFDDFSQQNNPAREKIFLSEVPLGKVEIRSSALKWSISGEFKIFFKIPFFVLTYLAIQHLGKPFDDWTFFCSWLRRRWRRRV